VEINLIKKNSKYVMQFLDSCKKTCREYMGLAKSFLHIHNNNLSSWIFLLMSLDHLKNSSMIKQE
jgi:hypothetical protein